MGHALKQLSADTADQNDKHHEVQGLVDRGDKFSIRIRISSTKEKFANVSRPSEVEVQFFLNPQNPLLTWKIEVDNHKRERHVDELKDE